MGWNSDPHISSGDGVFELRCIIKCTIKYLLFVLFALNKYSVHSYIGYEAYQKYKKFYRRKMENPVNCF